MRRRLVGGALGAAVAVLAAAPVPARAADDVPAAQVLFEEGRRLMSQHNYVLACPKLAESERLAPAIGTQFNLADCWEHVGRLASAWGAFIDVVDQTHKRGEAERESAARQRANALEPKLGKIVVEVPVPARVTGLEIRRDGEVLRDALWGVGVPLDAGEHLFEARAPGHRPWSTSVRMADGQSAILRVPVLDPAPVEGVAVPPPPPPPRPPPPDLEPKHDYTASIVVLSGAVVFAGVGVLGLVERQDQVDAYNNSSCPPISQSSTGPAYCRSYVSTANTWQDVAIAGFVAGGLALASGVTLWITAPRSSVAATTSSFRCFGGPTSVGCAGTF